MGGFGQKSKFYKISGHVSKMVGETDKMYYLSCPECKRKVIEEPVGFRCDHCDKTF